MHLFINESNLSSIKENLRKAHPETKSTHRTEAAAKGFGFSTYASFLAALKNGPLLVSADEDAFCSNLNVPPHSESREPARSLSRAVSRSMLQRVLDEHPDLTERGFDSIWQGGPDERRKPRTEREGLLIERRRKAYEEDWAADQFELALIFLQRQKKIKSLNHQAFSYNLKHRAENLSRKFGLFTSLGDYVSNGMLIAAAYALGFSVKRIAYDSYNAYLNISMQTVNASRGWTRNSRIENHETVLSMYEPSV